jgi:hypothetical protein
MVAKSGHWNKGILRRLNTTEIKFVRHKAGYNSLDHRRNKYILENPRVDPVEKKLAQ